MSGDYSSLEIVQALPTRFDPSPDIEALFVELAGAVILQIGTPLGSEIEGGGLVIDYQKPGQRPHRAVFGLNDLGMWVISNTPV